MVNNRPKKRREPVVIVLSDDEGPPRPPRQWVPPIVISSDEEGPPPPKRQRVVGNKENGIGREKIDKEKRIEDSALAIEHRELMRSWVDIGIQLAIRELNGEDVSAELGQYEILPDFPCKQLIFQRSSQLNAQPIPINMPLGEAYRPLENNTLPPYLAEPQYNSRPTQLGPGSYNSLHVAPAPNSYHGTDAYPIPYVQSRQHVLPPLSYLNLPNPSVFSPAPIMQYLTHHSGKMPGQSTSRQPLVQTSNSIQNSVPQGRSTAQQIAHLGAKILN